MKTSNKIIITVGFVCAFCLGLLFSFFIRIPDKNQTVNQSGDTAKSIKTESNISEPIKDKQEYKSYTIKLEGSEISAYINLPDGKSILWNSTSVPPALPQKDKILLEKGITTDNFEELCLYFEAYSS